MRNLMWTAVLAVMALTSAALAEGKKIGVAWGDLAQPRWRWDVTAMRSIIERSAAPAGAGARGMRRSAILVKASNRTGAA